MRRGWVFWGAVLACLSLARPAAVEAKPIALARNEVVFQTLRYLNVPYLWGGEYPRTGLDCSGFVQLVFRKVGLALPRVAAQQYRATRRVSPRNVLPGDLMFFSMKHPGSARVDHVGIYVGKGWFVHASVSNGVHVESIVKPYFLRRLVAVRRYRGF